MAGLIIIINLVNGTIDAALTGKSTQARLRLIRAGSGT